MNLKNKNITEEIDRPTWSKWVVNNIHHIEYFFNGKIVDKKMLNSLFESEGFDTDVDTVEDEIKKAVRSVRLGNLNGNALHIAHNSVGNRIDLVFDISGLLGGVESLSNDECVIRINGDIYEQDEMWNFGFAIYLTCDVHRLDFALAESKKKSSRKSLKESAKPINEKNVAKFVNELNQICHEKFDDDLFTKKYGNLYDFVYNYVGDVPNNFLVYDYNGVFDIESDTLAKPIVDKLAKQNGWYIEPVNSYEFCFEKL